MALKFGTSGVRGLVTEMTDEECYWYTLAFLRYLQSKTPVSSVFIAGDHRSSTPRIMRAVCQAVVDEGLNVINFGFVPTPVLLAAGIPAGEPSVMVTGSHIPDDRNGIKFNLPWGEVLKKDEAEITQYLTEIQKSAYVPVVDPDVLPPSDPSGVERYVDRYRIFFPPGSLQGLRLVFYEHSSVIRDILPLLLEELGAEVIRVGRSGQFIPVDTEAVPEPERLANWVKEHQADALLTTDGDGDRPLVVDEKGEVIRGDILGILVARYLDAKAVIAPVSCNTALEKTGTFHHIYRTRIGSPYVVEAMQAAAQRGETPVVGYEANGGFLTGTDIFNNDRSLPALPTRDAALPILAVLHAAVKKGAPLSALVADLPKRYTVSGLLREFPNTKGKALAQRFIDQGVEFANQIFQDQLGTVVSVDGIDGARMTLDSGDIVHLRPSGNAPEFRCYTESDEKEKAAALNRKALAITARLKNG